MCWLNAYEDVCNALLIVMSKEHPSSVCNVKMCHWKISAPIAKQLQGSVAEIISFSCQRRLAVSAKEN